ncbi:MAG: hypothetical protein LQ340_003007 [Diploschistes diacapsis]|nr:MAG: hypothetical protein LQ340_003007 [Diploschistes diacapsis]
MPSAPLHASLLRPAVLHILRAAGFHAARPAAADALVDLAARYLGLLAQRTADNAWLNHDDMIPTITDVRMALQEVGALYPELSPLEEQLHYDDDMRGMQNFINWIEGDTHKEMRRIAGLLRTPGELVDIEAGAYREDFLTALKKKHSKTGEESRFKGTALGKPAEEKHLKIDGGSAENIRTWQKMLQLDKNEAISADSILNSPGALSSASSPLSEV